MEVVLRTATPDGVAVVLPALVYAKILRKHPRVADPAAIDRLVRQPAGRRPDDRPWRERFEGRIAGRRAVAVVEYGAIPANIVTVFDSGRDR